MTISRNGTTIDAQTTTPHAFGSRAVAASVALLVGLSLVASAPAADVRPDQPAPDSAPTEAAASWAARQVGKSVLVESRTDETTEVRANPNGTFTMTQHVRPVRVRRGDGWTPVDTTLVKREDGMIGPRATAVELELSAGGPGSAHRPLVTATTGGAEIGLGWGSDLPEPVLSGSTATYPNVLLDVDLQVTADVLGFSELLVVKTPQAARNPKLRKITFGSHAMGLTVTAARDDALHATDATGRVVFTGNASRMWDSSGNAGDGVRTAVMGVEVSPAAISIVPDQDFLTAKDTRYPIYLDPTYRCTSCGKAHHNVVQSAWPDAHNFDRTDDVFNALMAGHVCDGPCFDARSYLRLNTWALAGRIIKDAYLHVDVVNSAYCDGLATSTQLWWVGWMDWNTIWNAQPGWISHLSSGNRTNNAGNCPSAGGMDLWAKSAVEGAAAAGAGELTLMLKGEREGGGSCDFVPPIPPDTPCTSWRRFNLNPYLVVDYNSVPNTPDALGVEGWGANPGDAIPCVLGAGRPFIPTRTPRLRARISDPDGGIMDAGFRVLRGPKDSNPWDGNQAYTSGIPSSSFAEVTISGGVIPQDGIYNWVVWGGDGESLTWSPYCEFEVDTVKPGQPAVRSDQYPAGRSAGAVGQPGSFTFAPATGTRDTAYYLYSFTAQGGDPLTRVTPAALNGSVTVQWTPALSGPQTLSVRAVDRAGNRSDISRYQVVVSDYQVGISGKVAQWSFEDSLADAAGAKTLSYEGPPPGTTYGSGHQGQGVVLDPGNTEFYQGKDALVRTDTSFTVSAWAKLTSTDGLHVIASQDGEHHSGFDLMYHSGLGQWTIVMSDRDRDDSPVWYAATAASPPTLNTWTHLTGVFDAPSRTLRLYVNGALSGQGEAPPAPWNATGQFVVGAAKTQRQRAYHFAGTIDSVRVHARALTAAEVAALHNGAGTANPVAEYLFENNLNNSGANNNLGPTSGVAYAAGYAARGFRVSATAGRWAQTSAPLFSTTGSFSFAAWAKLDDKAGDYNVASQDGIQVSGFLIRYSADVDRWRFGMPTTDTAGDTFQWAISQQSPQVGVWTHLAAVHDAGRHKLLLYVNGVLEGEKDLTATIAATGSFIVGSAKANGGRLEQFKGMIDEINVYDGALNAGEVAALANVPVERARYALDETGGAVPRDSIGGAQATVYGSTVTWGQHHGAPSASFTGNSTEHPGTVAGAGPAARWSMNNSSADGSGNGRTLQHGNNSGPTPATYSAGLINEGVVLNGVDQRLTAAGPVVDTARSYSVSAWVKADRAGGGWYTVASQDGVNVSPFYLQYSGGLDRWTFSLTPEDRTDRGVYRAASKLPPLVGAWTHLLGVYDAPAGRARLYVNGRLEGDVAVPPGWQATGTFAVGRGKWAGAAADFFPGMIDEFRAYDRALTATDAHGLWNLGSSIIAPRPAGLCTDQSFTIAAWARHAGYDGAPRQVVSAEGDRFAPMTIGYRPEWRRWSVFVVTGSEAQPVGRWVLSDNEAGSYADPNGWVHLAAVYDAPARTVRLYVNGVRQLTVPVSSSAVAKDPHAGSGITLWDSGRDLLIGRVTHGGVAVDHWKGAIRQVRVFSGVLPEACDNGAPNCMSQLPWQ